MNVAPFLADLADSVSIALGELRKISTLDDLLVFKHQYERVRPISRWIPVLFASRRFAEASELCELSLARGRGFPNPRAGVGDNSWYSYHASDDGMIREFRDLAQAAIRA